LVVIDFCFLIYCVMVLASSVFFFFFRRIWILLMFCSYYFTYFCRIMFSIVFFPFFKEFIIIIIIIIMYSFHRKKNDSIIWVFLFGICFAFPLSIRLTGFFFSYLIVRMRVKFVSCHFIIWLTVVDCFG